MAERTITILSPGTFSTIQDLGRAGFAHFGVPAGGAADARSHVIGNRMVGNPDDAASIEMTQSGATVRFSAATAFVVAGSPAEMVLGAPGAPSRRIECGRAHAANPGDVVSIGAIHSGARAYLCVAGGIDVPVVLGSRCTLTSAGLGGYEGRALRVGNVLPVGVPRRGEVHAVQTDVRGVTASRALDEPIRVIACEGDAARATLGGSEDMSWRVTPAYSRAGIRMTRGGPPSSAASAEMTSRATIPGMIQQTPSGELIILGPDGPTTGGYAVVGCVALADLPRVGQLRPGDEARFQVVSREHARAILYDVMRELDSRFPSVE